MPDADPTPIPRARRPMVKPPPPPPPPPREHRVSHVMSTLEVRDYYQGGMAHGELDTIVERIVGKKVRDVDVDEILARLAVSARQLHALYALSLRLDPAAGVQRVCETLADSAMSVFRSDRGLVVTYDEGSEEPKAIAESWLETGWEIPEQHKGPRLSRTVTETVLRSRQAVVSTDAPRDSRFDKSESLVMMNVHSLMAVPLLHADGCFGVLQVDDHRPGLRYADEDLRLLVAMASMGANAIQHAYTLEHQRAIIAELQHARDRLVRSEQLGIVGRIATSLAHEIKNQLGPLVMVDMLRRRFPEDAEVREYSEMILEAQQRVLRLVEEMRAYSQGESPERPDTRMPCDVGSVVHSVVRFLRFDRECRDVPVVVELGRPSIADLDADRIKQVIVNLLRNSVQAIKAAGSRDPRIHIKVDGDSDGNCVISVQDNGPGIPEENRARIFEPFFTTKGNEGTGLGLDICRQIVESHDGTLECHSAVGQGTVMVVTIPEHARR